MKINYDPKNVDAWICLCRNRSDLDGFFPCDKTGQNIEPIRGLWDEPLYRCDRCHRVIHADTREVVCS